MKKSLNIRPLILVFVAFLNASSIMAQDLGEKEKYVQERNLSEYYDAQIPWDTVTGIYPMPWLLLTPWKNDLTRRVDKVYGPSHDTYINTAWLVMELRSGLIPDRIKTELASSVLSFWENPDPRYYSRKGLQEYVANKKGMGVAGYLMMGRTLKPEQQFTVRHHLTSLIFEMHDFLQVLMETADKYKNAVMPGYTHLRHAQPTTLGHYLMSIYDPLWRSLEDLEQHYHDMSLVELGCGALAGTSWSIDRTMFGEYVGAEGLIENTNDAVSYSDGYVDLVATLSNITAVLSRLGEDLDYWSTLEYNFIDFKIGAGSYFMPNKRSNQSFFEHTYIQSAKVVGLLTESATMGIRIHHGDMNALEVHMQDAPLEAMHIVDAKILKPLMLHLPGMQVFEEQMLATARIGYSCATELSNEMVRRFDLDYRTAHDLVNLFVKESSRKNIPSKDADIDIFQQVSRDFIGRELDLTEKELRALLDPVHFIHVTNSTGAVSPKEVKRMIDERWIKLDAARERHMLRLEALERSKDKMMEDLKSFGQ
jgi:argininosuccinate lyase